MVSRLSIVASLAVAIVRVSAVAVWGRQPMAIPLCPDIVRADPVVRLTGQCGGVGWAGTYD